jgi:hypothetical protein
LEEIPRGEKEMDYLKYERMYEEKRLTQTEIEVLLQKLGIKP